MKGVSNSIRRAAWKRIDWDRFWSRHAGYGRKFEASFTDRINYLTQLAFLRRGESYRQQLVEDDNFAWRQFISNYKGDNSLFKNEPAVA